MVWWCGRALAKGEEITYNYQLDDCEGLFGRQVSALIPPTGLFVPDLSSWFIRKTEPPMSCHVLCCSPMSALRV